MPDEPSVRFVTAHSILATRVIAWSLCALSVCTHCCGCRRCHCRHRQRAFPMSIEATHFSRTTPSIAQQWVLLAGFGEQEAAEMHTLLAGDCQVAAARNAREAHIVL